MPAHAATAFNLAADTEPFVISPLVAILALALVIHLLSLLLFPWRKCRVCNNRKKFFNPFGGGNFRMCPACHGKGKEFRIGVRVIRGFLGFGFGRHN